MTSSTLCSRHGMQVFISASRRVVERAKERGSFAPGELVMVALDRPKRTSHAWMTRAEFDENGVCNSPVDGVVHVTGLPVIAALNRTWMPVCQYCVDELLVRSGMLPHTPTPVERAFDMSVIADNANLSGPLIRCDVHGVVVRRKVSPAIAAAIDGTETNSPLRIVKVVIVMPRAENYCWYDEACLRELFGAGIDVTNGVYRVEPGDTLSKLLDAGMRVCQQCVADWLRRQGIEPLFSVSRS
jgi:hypothetical protein